MKVFSFKCSTFVSSIVIDWFQGEMQITTVLLMTINCLTQDCTHYYSL